MKFHAVIRNHGLQTKCNFVSVPIRLVCQVDLDSPKRVTGIITQGAKDFGVVQFVLAYKIAYSDDGNSWTVMKDPVSKADKVSLHPWSFLLLTKQHILVLNRLQTLTTPNTLSPHWQGFTNANRNRQCKERNNVISLIYTVGYYRRFRFSICI